MTGSRLKKGGHFVGSVDYTAADLRFTRSKDGRTLYVIALGWPRSPLTVRSVGVLAPGPEATVELLGHDGQLSHRVTDQGQVTIDLPDLTPGQRPCRDAFVLRLTGFSFGLHAHARFDLPGAVKLSAERATLEGGHIRTEERNGRTNAGFWDRPHERVHWLVKIDEPGTYLVRGEFAATAESRLRVDVAGEACSAAVPDTGGWDNAVFVDLGSVKIEGPGVHHLVLGPADVDKWKAVNVFQLQLVRAP